MGCSAPHYFRGACPERNEGLKSAGQAVGKEKGYMDGSQLQSLKIKLNKYYGL